MKILHALLAILFSCFAVPALFATTCKNPPLLGASFPTWAPSTNILVKPGGVPANPLQAGVYSWDIGLITNLTCGPFFTFGNSTTDSITTTATINMAFAATFPSTGTAGNDDDMELATLATVTRGLTVFSTATKTAAGNISSINIYINSTMTATAAIQEVVAHEIGHTLNLYDCAYPTCPLNSSVMEVIPPGTGGGLGLTWNSTVGAPGPTICDMVEVAVASPNYDCPAGTVSTNQPCQSVGTASRQVGRWVQAAWRKSQGLNQGPGGGTGGTNPGGGTCSPIILDLSGKGFHLTNAANGASFDITGTGRPVQMGWIAEGADNAFLALPGSDGLVHNGRQLFGDFTPQPPSSSPNGFAALAVYDDPANGGNGDGIIDSRDAIYSSLRLWIDENHDGICQPGELYTLPSLGVTSISLHYSSSPRTDKYGNAFRYKAAVDPNDPDPSHVGRTAYDVFFVIGPSPSPTSTPEQLRRQMEQLTAARLRSKCAVRSKESVLSSAGGL
jgi:hypothetical protein